eukprot:2414086-Prymnesium_polylepis.1
MDMLPVWADYTEGCESGHRVGALRAEVASASSMMSRASTLKRHKSTDQNMKKLVKFVFLKRRCLFEGVNIGVRGGPATARQWSLFNPHGSKLNIRQTLFR